MTEETTQSNLRAIRTVAVTGPTASGKTALAVELCRRFDGEVVSFDSMQVYRGMPIGTAQPTETEKRGIPHHLIGFLPPETAFSCAEYVNLACETVKEIAARGKLPVLCGGTGLYLDSLLRGASSFGQADTDSRYREDLFRLAETEGAERVHALLREVDPESADAIHPNNIKRVIRALEIYHTTGKTKSELDRKSTEVPSDLTALRLNLYFGDRQLLYRRINERVDRMIAEGLPDEVRRLTDEGVFRTNTTAAQAIGYKELFGWLRGEESLDTAADRLKLATRHYAKRQLTWFSANREACFLQADRDGELRSLTEIADEASGILEACQWIRKQ